MDKKTMRAITVYGPKDARIENVPKPEAVGDMIVARVLRTGICATDLSIYTGESSFIRSGEIKYPCRFGHEWAGVVESVGPLVKDFKPGDRVYSDNFVSCGECEACRKREYMNCRSIRSVGTVNVWDGCYAEYMQMPERHVYHLPVELSMDEGALIEPASIAYDAFRGVTLTKNDTAVVFGTGAIGMVAVWLAKYYGAGKVILVGRSDDKLKIGKKIGADEVINGRTEDTIARIKELSICGLGANLIVETSGSVSALRDSIACATKYARISVVSFYERNVDDLPIDPLVLGCFSLVGAAGRAENAPAVCEIMRTNPVKLTPLFTHHIPFENTLDAFENEDKYHKTKIKPMITFDE